MALVIEDGTGIADAVSYTSAVDFSAYVTLRDRVIPEGLTDAQIEAKLLDAMDVLESKQYIGVKEFTTNTLSWPRMVGADECLQTLGVHSFPSNALMRAQIETAIDILAGNDPMATTLPGNNLPVIEDTIGPLTTKYASPGVASIDVDGSASYARVDAILAPWLAEASGGFRFKRV